MWFFRSPEIIFGEDSLSYLSNVEERRFLIVTDSNLVKTFIPDLVRSNLPESSESYVFSKIGEEPTVEEMLSDLEGISKFKPDCIIPVGGGSVIDTAKVLLFKLARPDREIFDLSPLEHFGLRNGARIIAIPTTSGTGSECSWAAVTSENSPEGKRKLEFASPEILPSVAILDPALTISLPRQQTVSTAVDAITHAIEAYVSSWRNPYSDALAVKAIELISSNLIKVLKDPSDSNARNLVHTGASMAGTSFSNSQIGLAHALGHALGAVFRIAHGNSVGLYLPPVIAFNNTVVRNRYAVINRIFPTEFRKRGLHQTLQSYFKAIGQPTRIKDTGIEIEKYSSNLDRLQTLTAESTGCLTNPRDPGSGDIRKILEEVMQSAG